MHLPDILMRVRGDRTQNELAEKVGVSRQTVSEWESGKREPRLESALELITVAEGEEKEALARHYGLRDMLMLLLDELGVRAK